MSTRKYVFSVGVQVTGTEPGDRGPAFEYLQRILDEHNEKRMSVGLRPDMGIEIQS